MKKINEFLLKFLAFDLPFVIILLVWGVLSKDYNVFKYGRILDIVAGILAWNFIIWLVILICIMMQLLINADFRSRFFGAIARLAGIKERDERESRAIDRASRYAYISTLALLVFVLFFYSVNVTVGKIPPEKVVDGKHKTLSIGFGFSLTDDKKQNKPEDTNKIFSNRDLPVSKWSMVALIIAWHLISFLFYLRRTNKFS